MTDIFKDLADTAGGFERTKIFPNLEVIDATPSALPADYIIIQDDEGYWIPALKVPGITYSNGDLVNVLFIKGTEPIAFQQGAGSPSSPSASVVVRKNSGANVGTRPRLNFIEGANITLTIADDAGNDELDITVDSTGGGNAWPLAGQNLLEGVNYATATLLIAAMTGGDIGYLGARSSSEAVTANEAGITLRGVGAAATIFTTTFTVTDPATLQDIKAIHSGAANTIGFNISDSTTLIDCIGIADSTGTTARGLNVTGSAQVTVKGGYYEGQNGTAVDIFADTGTTIILDGPVLFTGLLGGSGDIIGWYLDTLGAAYFVHRTGGVTETITFSNGNLAFGSGTAITGLAASESASGVAELGTQAEVDAGTDNVRIVTPLKLKTTPIDHLRVSKVVASDGSPDALTASSVGIVTINVALLLATGVSVDDIDTIPANDDTALITSGGVWDHTSISAAVHGLPANVHVVGDRSAAGRYFQSGAIGSTTSGTTPLSLYVDPSATVVTYPVAFSSAPIVITSCVAGGLINVATPTTTNFSTRKFIAAASFASVGSYIALGS